jgi:hypothetical protein
MSWVDNHQADTDIAIVVDTTVIDNVQCGSFNWQPNTKINDAHIRTLEQGKSWCQGDSGEIELLS